MAKVYPYIRFSTDKQAEGNSEERQLKLAREWAARNNHEVAQIFKDEGVSGFRGRNRNVGALSTVLELIHEKKIDKGSILLIENLDRLSREQLTESIHLFSDILRYGIKIQTLQPAEAEYSKDTKNQLLAFLQVLMSLSTANEESQKKSDRVKQAWEQKRRAGGLYMVKTPLWIVRKRGATQSGRHDPQTERFDLDREKAKAIKYIFTRTAAGCGQRQLLSELNERFSPIGKSECWNLSYISSVLNNRSVLGEYQPKQNTEDGKKRIVAGKPIHNYYPRIISKDLWEKVQTSKSLRKRMKGPSKHFCNIFTGIIFNIVDKSFMHIQTAQGKRRLVSYNHVRKLNNSCSLSISYDQFTDEFKKFIVRRLVVPPSATITDINKLEKFRRENLLYNKRISEIENQIANPNEGESFITLKRALEKVIRNKKQNEEKIRQYQLKTKQLDLPASSLSEALGQLQSIPSKELREKIHNLVKIIYVKPEKHFGRVWCYCSVILQNNHYAGMYIFGSNFSSIDEYEKHKDSDLNLSEKLKLVQKITLNTDCFKKTQKSYLGELAKCVLNPPKAHSVRKIPKELGNAVSLFLRTKKAQMKPSSFRTFPNKIKRFVDLFGIDFPIVMLNKARWISWRKHLNDKVQLGEIKPNTSRIIWQRAREFVFWLIDHKVLIISKSEFK